MPFGIVGRTGPGMRQWGLGIGPREGVLLGANLERAIVTNRDLRRTCATVPRRGPVPKLLWANSLLSLPRLYNVNSAQELLGLLA